MHDTDVDEWVNEWVHKTRHWCAMWLIHTQTRHDSLTSVWCLWRITMHDSFVYTHDMTHSHQYGVCDSFVYRHCMTRSHTEIRHDSFTHVTRYDSFTSVWCMWLITICYMTHYYAWPICIRTRHASFIYCSFTYLITHITWPIDTCETPYLYTWLTQRHNTRSISLVTRDMTHWRLWHDMLIYVTRPIDMCKNPHLYTWRDSVTW